MDSTSPLLPATVYISLLLAILVTASPSPQSLSAHQQQRHELHQREPVPRFTSHGKTFRTVIGDTLELPCEIEDLGTFVVLWRRGSAVMTAGPLMVIRDSRFRLVNGYNLEIQSVMPQDAGDYVCQIGSTENREQSHTVEILVPPAIRSQSTSNSITIRKGGTVTLECKASGNPVPTITWTKKDGMLASGEHSVEGFSLTLEQVDRHQAGVYRCTANNDVGQPATREVALNVMYAPEIEVERSWVHSGEGYEAQLVCVVHAEPQAEVLWYQDSFLLDPNERRTMETRGSKHTLSIRGVQSADFGNYSCVADNNMGRAKKYMELSGRPSPAQFVSAPFSRVRDAYNLSWVVQSWPPLEEVRLLWRRVHLNDTVPVPSKWHDVILAPGPNAAASSSSRGGRDSTSTSSEHTGSYLIRPLQPGAMYEAIVQAKNRYGWNDVSDLYKFYTRSASESLLDEADVMGDAGPHASTTGTSDAHPHRTTSPVMLLLGLLLPAALVVLL